MSEDRPEIKINVDDIPYNKLPEIYCQGDVYVCAQRADAFNLCGLEAMGCGLPTIQTDYGGQTDYMTKKNSLFVLSGKAEVKGDINYEGIKWAVPSIENLKYHLRWVFTNQKEIKEKGKQALNDVQKWRWTISAKVALSFLKELI